MEIPVYLFTGFLESGKTTFIQEVMEGDDFNAGERTLLLLCEEGEEELYPKRFFNGGKNVFIETIDSEEELTRERLESLQKEHKIERVVVEYNGMWMMDRLAQNCPPEWIVYQEMMFADARTFLTYNQNMRQLMFDKMSTADLIVFNRCERDIPKEEFHKTVRIANRKAQILYEYGPDDVEMDNIEDPLPYDMGADIIEIKDEWFAEWYRDINENAADYEGKTLTVKGRSVLGGGLDKDSFVFGRHIMTCCVEDIQFGGLVCRWKDAESKLEHGGWVMITAVVRNEYHEMYGEEGPVLCCTSVEPAQEANPEVAEF